MVEGGTSSFHRKGLASLASNPNRGPRRFRRCAELQQKHLYLRNTERLCRRGSQEVAQRTNQGTVDYLIMQVLMMQLSHNATVLVGPTLGQ